MVGEIYLAKIYFTDLSDYKVRPVLIIKEYKEDCICLQISSQIREDRLLITNNELIDGEFKKKSVVVIPKNFTLHKSILGRYVGKIQKNTMDKIFIEFCKEIGCNHE